MILKIKFQIKNLGINNSQRLLQDLPTGLTLRREELAVPTSKDIGAPCTEARMENLTEDHLRTMEEEIPHIEGKPPWV
jgi:hypothetical protein